MRTVRLGDVLEPRREVVHPRDNPRGEALFVGLEHIESNTGRRIGGLEVRLEELTGRKPRFHAGDIVYGYLRPYLNKVWVADRSGLCSVDQYVFEVRDAADPQFVAAYLRSPMFLARAPVDETPGQLPRIRLDEVLAVAIDLPTLPEQHRIGGHLTEQLSAVARARAATAERRKIVDRLIEAELSNALSSRAGWHGVDLHDVVEIQLGKMLSPASRTGRRPIPYVRNANVQWDRVDLTDIAEMDFDEREEAKFALRPGDVLVCEGGEPGRAAVWRGEVSRCCYQKALHRLRPLNDAVDPEFLVFTFWLASLRGEFTEDHAKTTIAHLPAVRLSELRVSLPSLPTQRRLASQIRRRLDAIRHLQREIQGQVDTIDRLPAAILRETFEDFAV